MLRRLRYLNNRHIMAVMNYQRAMSRATSATRPISGMPGSGNKSAGLDDAVVRVAETEETLRAIEEEQCQLREWLRPRLAAIEKDNVRRVMELRYMEGQTVQEISQRVAYSREHTYRLLHEGEQAVTQ